MVDFSDTDEFGLRPRGYGAGLGDILQRSRMQTEPYEPPLWSRTLTVPAGTYTQPETTTPQQPGRGAGMDFPWRFQAPNVFGDLGPAPEQGGDRFTAFLGTPEAQAGLRALGALPGERQLSYDGWATAPITVANFPTYGREGFLALLSSVFLEGGYQQQQEGVFGQDVEYSGPQDLNLGQQVLKGIIDGGKAVGDFVWGAFDGAARWRREEDNLYRAEQVQQVFATGSANRPLIPLEQGFWDNVLASIGLGASAKYNYQELAVEATKQGHDIVSMAADYYDLPVEVVAQIYENPTLSREQLRELTQELPLSQDALTNLLAEGGFQLALLVPFMAIPGGAAGLAARAGTASRLPSGIVTAAQALRGAPLALRSGSLAQRAGSATGFLTRRALQLNALNTTAGWTTRGLEWGVKQYALIAGDEALARAADRLLWEMPWSMNPGLNLIDGFTMHPIRHLKELRGVDGTGRRIRIGDEGSFSDAGAINLSRRGDYLGGFIERPRNLYRTADGGLDVASMTAARAATEDIRLVIAGKEEIIPKGAPLARLVEFIDNMSIDEMYDTVLRDTGWERAWLHEAFDSGKYGLTVDDLRNYIVYGYAQVVRDRGFAPLTVPGATLREKSRAFIRVESPEILAAFISDANKQSSHLSSSIRGQWWELADLNDSRIATLKARKGEAYNPYVAFESMRHWVAASKRLHEAYQANAAIGDMVVTYSRRLNRQYLQDTRASILMRYDQGDTISQTDVLLLRRNAGPVEHFVKEIKSKRKWTREQFVRMLERLERIADEDTSPVRRLDPLAENYVPGQNFAADARALGIEPVHVRLIENVMRMDEPPKQPPPTPVLQRAVRDTGGKVDELLLNPRVAWQKVTDWYESKLAEMGTNAQIRDAANQLEGLVAADAAAKRLGDDVAVRVTEAADRIGGELANPPIKRPINAKGPPPEGVIWASEEGMTRWSQAVNRARALVGKVKDYADDPLTRMRMVGDEDVVGRHVALMGQEPLLEDITRILRYIRQHPDELLIDDAGKQLILDPAAHPFRKIDALADAALPGAPGDVRASIMRLRNVDELTTIRQTVGQVDTIAPDTDLAAAIDGLSARMDAHLATRDGLVDELLAVSESFDHVEGVLDLETRMLVDRRLAAEVPPSRPILSRAAQDVGQEQANAPARVARAERALEEAKAKEAEAARKLADIAGEEPAPYRPPEPVESRPAAEMAQPEAPPEPPPPAAAAPESRYGDWIYDAQRNESRRWQLDEDDLPVPGTEETRPGRVTETGPPPADYDPNVALADQSEEVQAYFRREREIEAELSKSGMSTDEIIAARAERRGAPEAPYDAGEAAVEDYAIGPGERTAAAFEAEQAMELRWDGNKPGTIGPITRPPGAGKKANWGFIDETDQWRSYLKKDDAIEARAARIAGRADEEVEVVRAADEPDELLAEAVEEAAPEPVAAAGRPTPDEIRESVANDIAVARAKGDWLRSYEGKPIPPDAPRDRSSLTEYDFGILDSGDAAAIRQRIREYRQGGVPSSADEMTQRMQGMGMEPRASGEEVVAELDAYLRSKPGLRTSEPGLRADYRTVKNKKTKKVVPFVRDLERAERYDDARAMLAKLLEDGRIDQADHDAMLKIATRGEPQPAPPDAVGTQPAFAEVPEARSAREAAATEYALRPEPAWHAAADYIDRVLGTELRDKGSPAHHGSVAKWAAEIWDAGEEAKRALAPKLNTKSGGRRTNIAADVLEQEQAIRAKQNVSQALMLAAQDDQQALQAIGRLGRQDYERLVDFLVQQGEGRGPASGLRSYVPELWDRLRQAGREDVQAVAGDVTQELARRTAELSRLRGESDAWTNALELLRGRKDVAKNQLRTWLKTDQAGQPKGSNDWANLTTEQRAAIESRLKDRNLDRDAIAEWAQGEFDKTALGKAEAEHFAWLRENGEALAGPRTTRTTRTIGKTVRGDDPVKGTKLGTGTVESRLRLMEADELIDSWDDAYPRDRLQPRDTATQESEQLVREIAADPLPDRLLRAESDMTEGAPVVSAEGWVEVGNHRSRGLKLAYEEGNAEGYVNALAERAEEFGFTAAEVRGMNRPVLVREVADEYVSPAYARAWNQGTGMSARTEAGSIGKNLDLDTMADLTAKGTLDDVLATQQGADIIKRIMGEGGEAFAKKYIENGTLTPEGQMLVKTAIVTRIVGDERVAAAILATSSYERGAAPILARAIVREGGRLMELTQKVGADNELALGDLLSRGHYLLREAARVESGSTKGIKGGVQTAFGAGEEAGVNAQARAYLRSAIDQGNATPEEAGFAAAILEMKNADEVALFLEEYIRPVVASSDRAGTAQMFGEEMLGAGATRAQRLNVAIQKVNEERMAQAVKAGKDESATVGMFGAADEQVQAREIPAIPDEDGVARSSFETPDGTVSTSAEKPVATTVDEAVSAQASTAERVVVYSLDELVKQSGDQPIVFRALRFIEAKALKRQLTREPGELRAAVEQRIAQYRRDVPSVDDPSRPALKGQERREHVMAHYYTLQNATEEYADLADLIMLRALSKTERWNAPPPYGEWNAPMKPRNMEELSFAEALRMADEWEAALRRVQDVAAPDDIVNISGEDVAIIGKAGRRLDPDYVATTGQEINEQQLVTEMKELADTPAETVVRADDEAATYAAREAGNLPHAQPLDDQQRLVILNEKEFEQRRTTLQNQLERARGRRVVAEGELRTARDEAASVPRPVRPELDLPDEAWVLWQRYVYEPLGEAMGISRPRTIGEVEEVLRSLDYGFPAADTTMTATERGQLRTLLRRFLNDKYDEWNMPRTPQEVPLRRGPSELGDGIRGRTPTEHHLLLDELANELATKVFKADDPLEGYSGVGYEFIPPPKKGADGAPLDTRLFYETDLTEELRAIDDVLPGMGHELASGRMMTWEHRTDLGNSTQSAHNLTQPSIIRATRSLLDTAFGPRRQQTMNEQAVGRFMDDILEITDAEVERIRNVPELVKMHEQDRRTVMRLVRHWHEELAKETMPVTGMRKYRRVGLVDPDRIERWTYEYLEQQGDSGARILARLRERQAAGIKAPVWDAWRRADNRVRAWLRQQDGGAARAIDRMYETNFVRWGSEKMAGLTANYHIFRFLMDIRWLAMEFLEAPTLLLSREGPGALMDAINITRGKMTPQLMFGAEGTFENTMSRWAWWLALLDGSGAGATTGKYMRFREAAVFAQVQRAQQRGFIKALEELAAADQRLARIMKDFGDTPGQYLQRLDRDWKLLLTKQRRDIPEGELREMLKPYVDEGTLMPSELDDIASNGTWVQSDTLTQAIAHADDPVTRLLLRRLEVLNSQAIDDAAQLIFGQADRSNVQRLMNHPLLYWPISYQIKATKWLAGLMLDRVMGVDTGAGGAVTMGILWEQNREALRTDRAFREFLADNEELLFFLSMLLPVTPMDIGVSLSPWTRIGISIATNGEAYDYNRNVFSVGPFYSYTELFPRLVRERAEGTGPIAEVARGIQRGLPVTYRQAPTPGPPTERVPFWPDTP